MRVLPTFRGYTVDVRLNEFRKVDRKLQFGIIFVPFDSKKGERLFAECSKTPEGKKELVYLGYRRPSWDIP